MTVLPDHLRPGLRVVFCGTAPGLISAARGHYYAGPGNAFWPLLHDAGFTPARHLGQPRPSLGRQEWTFGGAKVFVLPSPSGRNQGRSSYDGRPTRLAWWRELAELSAAQ